MNKTNNIFTFENVSFGYLSAQKKVSLIQNFSGTFERGEFIILIGRNGTGKSTILKSLVRLLPYLNGKITLNEKVLENYSITDYAKLVSFVSTNLPVSGRMTVFELISLGRFPYTNWLGLMNKEDLDKVHKAIDSTRLNELLNKQIFRISDGERQRAMIARTLAQDTPVIVLDEPTAFLDLPNKYELAGLLSKLSSLGKTVIMSTHDIEIALRFPDKLLIIHDNKIFDGSPEDMVINGNFNEIFHSPDLNFNQLTGEIELAEKRANNIFLEANNPVILNWTKKALKRAGFNISEEKAEDDRIVVQKGNNVWIWSCYQRNQKTSFKNIYDLIKFLKINSLIKSDL